MGVINRILLFLYTLCFGIASLGVVLFVLKVAPERLLQNEYQFIVGQWQTGVIAGLLFLVSLHLFLCSISFKSAKSLGDVIVVSGRTGTVNVSMSALKATAVRLAVGALGVRDAKIKAVLVKGAEAEERLSLDVRLEIGQERPISDISDEIRQSIGGYLEHQVGIKDFDIAIAVESIASNTILKKRKLK